MEKVNAWFKRNGAVLMLYVIWLGSFALAGWLMYVAQGI